MQFNREKLEQQVLGLVLSKKIIEKLNGSMTIKSEEQKGTTIIIRLAG